MKRYAIGLYEKAMPPSMDWREKLTFAKEAGYDYVEMSVDETDGRLARLDWTAEERLELVRTMVEVGLGCDYYLPFFKFIPELKFCFSLSDVFEKKHADELTDATKQAFARSIDAAYSKMVVLTLYFE